MSPRIACRTLLAMGLFATPAAAQINVTAPASTVNIKAANDFATVSYNDPMDMKQNTDLGWTVWSNDVTPSGLTSVGFNQPATGGAPNSSDWFRALSSNTAPNFYLLDASNRFSAKLG